MKAHRRQPLLRLVLLASAFLCAAVDPAAAAQLSCGDVVTQDTRLENDLLDCPGDGLVIGASGITLSLGGHRVDGLGAESPFGSTGIDNSGGYDDVKILNGSVTEFRTGVELVGTQGAVVRLLSLERNVEAGIQLDGFAKGDSFENRILSNDASHTTFGEGIVLRGSDRNRIHRNHVGGNGGAGIALTFSSHMNSVIGNAVSASRANGMLLMDRADGNAVKRNSVSGSGLGGIAIFGSSDNRVVANSVTENTAGGISIGSGFRDPPADRNAIVHNIVLRNDADGIVVGGPSEFMGIPIPGPTATGVSRNTSDGNADDGIDVRSPSAVISYNGADDNGDLGIFAVPGVTDGGGNHASGNGNPAQCVNFAC
jgi:large repetitive protein